MSDSVNYTHRAYSGSTDTQTDSGTTQQDSDTTQQDSSDTQSFTDNSGTTTQTTKTPMLIFDDSGTIVMSITYSNPVTDTDTSSRGIDESGTVFTLTHSVNTFSGVK